MDTCQFIRVGHKLKGASLIAGGAYDGGRLRNLHKFPSLEASMIRVQWIITMEKDDSIPNL